MDGQPDDILETGRKLSEESRMGLLFCYKALKRFDFDYRQALNYLRSYQCKREFRK